MHKQVVNKIKTLRTVKGFSQLDMAEKLHIDTSAYARLESGKTYSWAKYLEQLLQIFEVSPEEFFSGMGNNIKITNHSGSFGGNAHVENLFADNKEKFDKIELLYEERLKDKDELIEHLKSLIK